MAFLDHILACNSHDRAKFRPFLVAQAQIGWVRHDVAAILRDYADTLVVGDDAVRLHPRLGDPADRSTAMDGVCQDLHLKHGMPALRGERYGVAPRWGGSPVLTLDRGVVSLFGVRAYGVHVNGVIGDGGSLWIAKRAVDKAVAPGKLDNFIAGGQPAGLSLMDNLVKEAAEEADVPAALARQARPVGAVSYCQEDEWGLKPDTMFCFDLAVPPDFVPRNTDGEIESFHSMAVGDVVELVRNTTEFKFNVNLVLLDFFIRRGWLSPDTEPDYVEIVQGLRRR